MAGCADDDSSVNWSSFLHSSKHVPQNDVSKLLSNLFVKPPPLDLVRNAQSGGTQYQNVPETPSARKYGPDRQWFAVQKKLEECMHTMIHMLETDDKEQLTICAALVRSAWEDCNHNRRCLLAGKDRVKLDKRADDTRPTLLSKEEESKISRGKGNNPPRQLFSSSQRSDSQSQARSTSQSRKGKGKGKGKGQK